ncbi:Intradiol ring-cleavage dioxygenase [Thelephora terrestris]|uniref:Intradiol ring-cleavage dioxygenase n=1 Tax=Thelephora terrestris TaxID=56493 RepID=A0A9P6HSN7_9AGAM|nr:Intradiol ring-cleavage dioxygenase [Thelephora terrestris]
MQFGLLLSLLSLSAFVTAHSMHQRRIPTLEEIAREEIRARERVVMARDCEQEIREHLAMRMRRRAEIQKRHSDATGVLNNAVRASSPHYTTIQNTTCLTSPEVVEGPYYVNNEMVRQDVRESQKGVTLVMDFGVMDTSTCTPINNAFVEIWHANATGSYGGYSTNNFDSSETFLRGGWYTDSNGIAELTTVYPGYYTGRTPHVHIMVRTNWTESANGTLVSHSGSLVHIGQMFFNESWNDEVFATSPYTEDKNDRTLNSQDSILSSAFQSGYNAYTSLQYLNGNDLSGGLVGYLTLGVDTRSTKSITNTNYNGVVGSVSNNGSSNGSSNGTSTSGSNNGTTNGTSNAESQRRGWENTVYLSLLMLAFFGYKAQSV